MNPGNLETAAAWFSQHYVRSSSSSRKRRLDEIQSSQAYKAHRRDEMHFAHSLATKQSSNAEIDVISLLSSDDEKLVLNNAPNPSQKHRVSLDQRPKSLHVAPSNEINAQPPPVGPSIQTEPLEDSHDEQYFAHETPAITDLVGIQGGPRLCKEQSDLVDLILSGRNVFFTGSAGTGKSTVLKEFVKCLRSSGKDVQIVAPTGRAALDINGSTTWTYAGWTPDSMKKPLSDLIKAAHGKFVYKRLNKTDVLVIDEISMVENFHFERLNSLMKAARGNELAFGGVQLIVTGDFCQLPPVRPFQFCLVCGRELAPLTAGTVFKCARHGEYKEVDKWAFRSKAWSECGFQHVQLSEIHRQKDEKFIKILQKCRISNPLSDKDKNVLLNHKSDTTNAVKLFSTREEVGRINQVEFCKLTSPKLVFSCYDFFRWNEQKHRHLASKGNKLFDGSLQGLKDHRYETKLELKVGMLVVLLANLDIPGGLVNGSQGVIVAFKKHENTNLAKVKAKDSSRSDEGATHRGEYGTMKETAIETFIGRAAVKEWPVVRFNNGIERPIIADCTINELGDEREYSLLSRTQIPLGAAWAMSIHKAQGMTLDKVIVDLSKSFEEGQLYVALSRARSLEGLRVEGLGTWKGRGNEQVKEFLRKYFGT